MRALGPMGAVCAVGHCSLVAMGMACVSMTTTGKLELKPGTGLSATIAAENVARAARTEPSIGIFRLNWESIPPFFLNWVLIELVKVTEISKLCSISDVLRAANHAGVTVRNRHRESGLPKCLPPPFRLKLSKLNV